MDFYIRKLSDIFFFSILNGYTGLIYEKKWQDDAARCIQCENEGGSGDCYVKTKVAVAVAARKRRSVVIGCKSLP